MAQQFRLSLDAHLVDAEVAVATISGDLAALTVDPARVLELCTAVSLAELEHAFGDVNDTALLSARRALRDFIDNH